MRLLSTLVAFAVAQGPAGTCTCQDGSKPTPPSGAPSGGSSGGGGGGVAAIGTTSTSCTKSPSTCAADGSDGEVIRTGLTYSATTGKLTGKYVTNNCPSSEYYNPRGITPSCEEVTFPVSGYGDGAAAAPLRGTIAKPLFGGGEIYGPLEAGFGNGMPEACNTDGAGVCVSGLTVPDCEETLKAQCGAENVKLEMMLDDCGGHAMPYHFHIDPKCSRSDYDQTDASKHSPALGLALDGYVIYGLHEGSDAFPKLDACGGHTGPVPEDSALGIAAGGADVYHYHMMTYAPYTLGCFGPVASLEECKALYPECENAPVEIDMPDGTKKSVVQDCPCYQHETGYTTAKVSDLTPYYQDLLSRRLQGSNPPPPTCDDGSDAVCDGVAAGSAINVLALGALVAATQL